MIVCDEVSVFRFFHFSIGKENYKTSSPLVKPFVKFKDGNRLGLKKQKDRLKELADSSFVVGSKKIYAYHIFKI